MKSAEFVTAYPIDLSLNEIHGDQPALIHPAQELSYGFGRLLHRSLMHGDALHPDILADPSMPTGKEGMRLYKSWSEGVEELGLEALKLEEYRAFTELNFHRMNGYMLGMWEPIIDGKWSSEGNRQHRIRASQQAIALAGFSHYSTRQEFVDESGSHILHEDSIVKTLFDRVGGIVQEMDAAVVLLEVVKQNPNLTIVPAPLNFERTRNKSVNVDHVVVDVANNSAVGVQVKTAVRRGDFNNADHERVVFVDGTTDLDNVMAQRTRRNSSSETVKPYAGIISAKLVSQMKVDLKKSHGWRNTRKTSQRSKELVGDVRLDYQTIVEEIGSRILAKL